MTISGSYSFKPAMHSSKATHAKQPQFAGLVGNAGSNGKAAIDTAKAGQGAKAVGKLLVGIGRTLLGKGAKG